MYQPVALFIGLRYMRGGKLQQNSLRSLRFTAFHYRHYHGVMMALVWLLSVMNGRRELQNTFLV